MITGCKYLVLKFPKLSSWNKWNLHCFCWILRDNVWFGLPLLFTVSSLVVVFLLLPQEFSVGQESLDQGGPLFWTGTQFTKPNLRDVTKWVEEFHVFLKGLSHEINFKNVDTNFFRTRP